MGIPDEWGLRDSPGPRGPKNAAGILLGHGRIGGCERRGLPRWCPCLAAVSILARASRFYHSVNHLVHTYHRAGRLLGPIERIRAKFESIRYYYV
jgi:hypothetical protein